MSTEDTSPATGGAADGNGRQADGTDGRYRAMTYHPEDGERVTIIQDRQNENAWLQSTRTAAVEP